MRSFEWINKQGKPEAIDPVVDFVELDDHFVVHNGIYEYVVMKADIERWWFEETPD